MVYKADVPPDLAVYPCTCSLVFTTSKGVVKNALSPAQRWAQYLTPESTNAVVTIHCNLRTTQSATIRKEKLNGYRLQLHP